jgi:hypothetical protein
VGESQFFVEEASSTFLDEPEYRVEVSTVNAARMH